MYACVYITILFAKSVANNGKEREMKSDAFIATINFSDSYMKI